jgi:uncharacterized membrane protein
MNVTNIRSLAASVLPFAVLLLPAQASHADTPAALEGAGCSNLRYTAIPIAAPDGARLIPNDFNEHGEVVGTVQDASTSEAMLWKDGQYVRLGERIFSGALISNAAAINNRGQITGDFVTSDFNTEEYVLDRHGVTYLMGAFTSPREINERGEVVGLAFADGQLHAAVWRDGETIALPMAPGHNLANAFDINNHGTVVGFGAAQGSTSEAVVWYAPYTSTPTIIPLPPDANGSPNVLGVNDRDQVILEVGVGANIRSFVWTDGRPLRVLEPLPGFLDSSAADINNAGVVVGFSSGGGEPFTAATVWRGGETCAIGDLVTTPGLDGPWTHATRVNQRGEILALMRSAPVGAGWFLLRPHH